jgi:FixJ family two-component response regulator
VLVSIVDDDRIFRECMCRLMRLQGYTVDIFSRLQPIFSRPPACRNSLLIADVHMPAMTGLELYRQLIDTGQAIPTILVTAFPNDVDRARALNDGVACYVRKPVNEEHLTQCVREALRSDGSPEGVVSSASARGNVNRNTVPCGSFASTHSFPPWASMMERQIESPVPVSLDFVV